jgi:hypothetical protein
MMMMQHLYSYLRTMPLGDHLNFPSLTEREEETSKKKTLHWRMGLRDRILVPEEGKRWSLSFETSALLKRHEFSAVETSLGILRLSVIYMVWGGDEKTSTIVDLEAKNEPLPITSSPWPTRRSSPIPSPTTQRKMAFITQHYLKKEETTKHRLSIETNVTNYDDNHSNISLWTKDGEERSLSFTRKSCSSRDQHVSHSSNEFFGSFVGTYEESILNGRVSTLPSKPIEFLSEIGVFGKGTCKTTLKCPSHVIIPFAAYFYEIEDTESPSPYVGDIDLQKGLKDQKKYKGMYRIPPAGQLQILIKNINKIVVKIFLVAYDVSNMAVESKTFLRQVSHGTDPPAGLRYAIQANMMRDQQGRIFLYKTIRVVFSHRSPDGSEKLEVITYGPQTPHNDTIINYHQPATMLPLSQSISQLSRDVESLMNLNQLVAPHNTDSTQNNDPNEMKNYYRAVVNYEEEQQPFSSDHGTLLHTQHDR